MNPSKLANDPALVQIRKLVADYERTGGRLKFADKLVLLRLRKEELRLRLVGMPYGVAKELLWKEYQIRACDLSEPFKVLGIHQCLECNKMMVDFEETVPPGFYRSPEWDLYNIHESLIWDRQYFCSKACHDRREQRDGEIYRQLDKRLMAGIVQPAIQSKCPLREECLGEIAQRIPGCMEGSDCRAVPIIGMHKEA